MTMRTIKLYGVLRSRFGREYRLDVHSVGDAISALCNLLPGFERFMRTADERGLTFAVFCGRRNIAEGDLGLRGSDDSEIRIAPIVQGSKNGGLFQTILGVVIIAVAWWNPMGWVGGASMLMAGGAGLAIGGVSQMLVQAPATTTAASNEDGNNPSYGFGGAVTTVAQGNPWPVLYGEREIGGAVDSGGVYTEDQL
ncbi:tail assembly protein [Pseudomonas sp. PDM12]|uniref:tail assembly protein n=1 Tax=Pseudomonas sp. PDM12 TaxID=2769260 RepID=UPI00178307BE|nr:tail assembly protein [Pseudomonas sp. PDM12]MBD9657491.1 tail assembly protein [Pseudomonas sp. PDM12]